ncbi:MAG TPA: hypothetical protein VN836_07750 [Verrucomicrobiae bacterium]|nr:hypothetical protein [Verrucomicrobiae bacterium]
MKNFDLNIDKILENWEVFHAVRELIANAIDEQILTNTRKPMIFQDEAGWWHVRDFGRGLRYQDLIQTENPEKLEHANLIGKFGIGLKDALATFDRRPAFTNESAVRARFLKCRIGTLENQIQQQELLQSIPSGLQIGNGNSTAGIAAKRHKRHKIKELRSVRQRCFLHTATGENPARKPRTSPVLPIKKSRNHNETLLREQIHRSCLSL